MQSERNWIGFRFALLSGENSSWYDHENNNIINLNRDKIVCLIGFIHIPIHPESHLYTPKKTRETKER